MTKYNRAKKRKKAFNQAEQQNEEYFVIYLDWILSLAMNRFKYFGLPETCDSRYLERALLNKGYATIARPANTNESFVSLNAIWNGNFNIYGNPTKWKAYSQYNQNWKFDVTPENGVFIWDNESRSCPWRILEKFAYDLAKIQRSRELNRTMQNTPLVLTCPPEGKQEAENIMMSIFTGQPAIGMFQNNGINFDALNVNVEYKADTYQRDFENTFNQIYSYLGIKNLTRKNERMIEDEVLSQNEPCTIMATNALASRQRALDKFNKRFGFNSTVVWNKDLAIQPPLELVGVSDE